MGPSSPAEPSDECPAKTVYRTWPRKAHGPDPAKPVLFAPSSEQSVTLHVISPVVPPVLTRIAGGVLLVALAVVAWRQEVGVRQSPLPTTIAVMDTPDQPSPTTRVDTHGTRGIWLGRYLVAEAVGGLTEDEGGYPARTEAAEGTSGKQPVPGEARPTSGEPRVRDT